MTDLQGKPCSTVTDVVEHLKKCHQSQGHPKNDQFPGIPFDCRFPLIIIGFVPTSLNRGVDTPTTVVAHRSRRSLRRESFRVESSMESHLSCANPARHIGQRTSRSAWQ
jgi:hypothetical protein